MAPKTKSKKSTKTKSSAVVDGLSTEDMSKDQLEEHIIRLREELDREREERSFFQLERDKMLSIWEISKRSLDETKAQLRNRTREREEAEERHRVEISDLKQKMKHVLSEQHNTVCDQKVEAVASTSQLRNQHTESELDFRKKVQELLMEFGEKKLMEEAHMNELTQQHLAELKAATHDHECRLRKMGDTFLSKTRSLMEEKERERKVELEKVDEQGRSLELELSKGLQLVEEDQPMIGTESHQVIKFMKGELETAQKEHKQVDKKLSAARKEKQRLVDGLRDAQLNQCELQKRLVQHNQAKAEKEKSKASLKQIECEITELTVEIGLLQQACKQVEQERDELVRRHKKDSADIQHRGCMKELLLREKLEMLTKMLEKNKAQLSAAMSNIDPTIQTHNILQEQLQGKKGTIQLLEEQLDQLH